MQRKYHYNKEREYIPTIYKVIFYPILYPIMKVNRLRNKLRNKTHCLYCGERFVEGLPIVKIRIEYTHFWKPRTEYYCAICGAEHIKIMADWEEVTPESSASARAFAKKAEDRYWGRTFK